MSDVADLWRRIEEAKKRLGASDEAQIKRIQGINEQVKEIRAGLNGRYRELERHREEVSRLRHENEQLRRMLHRLLLAIEQRYSGHLKDIVKELEGQVSALVPLAAKLEDGEPLTAGKSTPHASPSEKDSRWLHEIMERARELTDEGVPAARPVSAVQASQRAVA